MGNLFRAEAVKNTSQRMRLPWQPCFQRLRMSIGVASRSGTMIARLVTNSLPEAQYPKKSPRISGALATQYILVQSASPIRPQTCQWATGIIIRTLAHGLHSQVSLRNTPSFQTQHLSICVSKPLHCRTQPTTNQVIPPPLTAASHHLHATARLLRPFWTQRQNPDQTQNRHQSPRLTIAPTASWNLRERLTCSATSTASIFESDTIAVRKAVATTMARVIVGWRSWENMCVISMAILRRPPISNRCFRDFLRDELCWSRLGLGRVVPRKVVFSKSWAAPVAMNDSAWPRSPSLLLPKKLTERSPLLTNFWAIAQEIADLLVSAVSFSQSIHSLPRSLGQVFICWRSSNWVP